MSSASETLCRYFVSYSGVKLPLKLINEIDEAGLANRNTYYCGYFDAEEKLLRCQKVVYGEVESEHVYEYHADGRLKQARIFEDDEERVCDFA
jgi:hypothetical protein